jgi:hypothetical protein
LARRTGRPIRYLQSSGIDKEQIAREIACSDRIEQELALAKACSGRDPEAGA